MQASVSVRNLAIAYGDQTVIDDLSLDIGKQEFLVLLGPSGCGKSTLLNAIAGLQEITRGEIWISDKNVTWAEPSGRGIDMVFRSGAAAFDLAAYPVARLPPGPVTLGFRPEHVTLGASLGPRPGTTVAVVNHSISVLHLAGGTDGVDVLVNIEALQFSDGRLFV